MIEKKNLVLEKEGRKPIIFDAFYKESHEPKPVIIFCHGYKGYKDWGAWNLVANEMAEQGFFFVKMNFSHNGGTVKQPIDFPDLEAFANNNFTIELDDLDNMIHHLMETKEFGEELDRENISLIGHSRGGGIVLIKGEEHPAVKKVISWAGVSDFKIRFQEGTENFKSWKDTGITYVENGRTKQQMPHYFQFYTNFIENKERLTIRRAVEQMQKPQLIVHGTADPTVTLEEAQQLYKWNPNSELKVIENADHVFGAKHPWEQETMPQDLGKAVKMTIEFLKLIQ